jgi:hypothetical protein
MWLSMLEEVRIRIQERKKSQQQQSSTTPTVHNKSIKKFKPACGLKQKRPLA